ncbi:Z1 domain-containing protein [Williamsia serinedens]|uniref:Z1 domain-containing protein n=1 Tax=Williamsia serinedens TaxID=391736 RepID=A0ABT1H0N8_9NOCA|nr:Z1 domain-containing protein [Williamsia serinedens]MCP2160802.1 Z1 domain-containing protein [Williamsia serinedens]
MNISERQALILNQLELLVRRGDTVDEAGRKLKTLAGDHALIDGVIALRKEISDHTRVVAQGTALYDPEDGADPWYTGPSAEDVFWPKLKTALLADSSWKNAVPDLDEASTDIVGLLADPHSEQIKTRGLVLGFVQSGKTANFTATIAKAADAGYRLFIVLSGVHNALRRQTQLRLEQQLSAQHPTQWLQLTDEYRDFGNPVRALPLVAGTDLRLIAVVKKNVSRMTRLRDWLNEANKHGGLDTCPVLIIDDESDQASINTAKNAELDRTRINQLLVDLLRLPRVAYLGYTATPFANVLVNPNDAGDIYPRSFIYSLRKPDTYFGARELFGALVSEDEQTSEQAPHDMIRIISSEEAAQHSPKQLQQQGAVVTSGLADAIRWFVLASAARRVRGQTSKHSSMLVHTTMRVQFQQSYLSPIKEFIRSLDLKREQVRGALKTLWDHEMVKEPPSKHNLTAIDFTALEPELAIVLNNVKVVADNSASTDRLIYGDDPATVIAVGGNTLSRGLTLEGLVSSYFLRSSNTYDSLLQMGRWFGYRPGYSDLPRIWTTAQLAEDFEFLADVEDGLRTEISRYRLTDGSTPANLPVRILLHPKMHVTAKVKMQFAVTGDTSFSGQHPQTTYFSHLDETILSQNLNAVKHLIISIMDKIAQDISRSDNDSLTIFEGVSNHQILSFIEHYSFHSSSEMNSEKLTTYIKKQNKANSLLVWNVVIMGRKSAKRSIDLGIGKKVPLMTRSKLKRSEAGVANIGTLMSRPDRVIDIMTTEQVRDEISDSGLLKARNASQRASLIIYPIDKDSQPKADAGLRVALDAKRDLMGVAFSFPEADPSTEDQPSVHVDLTEIDTETEDFVEDYTDNEGSRDDIDLGVE